LAQSLGPQHMGYGIRESLQRALLSLGHENDFSLRESYKIWGQFEPFWHKGFFQGENMRHDRPYKGAADFVNRLSKGGAKILYLTGRAEDVSKDGTLMALNTSGFPEAKEANLFMKPDMTWVDVEYKKYWAEKFSSLDSEALFFVENEPENICLFAQAFRSAQIIFFHSIMSPRIPSLEINDLLAKRPLFRLTSYCLS